MVSCTVCMIAKNEAPYLLEWVAYYRNLGFTKIIVFENNSEDSSKKILAKLHQKKIITYIEWKLGKHESPQITAYIECLRIISTDWVLFVDCDEFLVFNKGTLGSMLEYIHPQKEVSAIGVNWRIFGSSGLAQPDTRPVIERFTKAADIDFESNKHLKSFLRVGTIGPNIDMHLSDVEGRVVFSDGTPLSLESRGRATEVKFDTAQINHYFGKSRPEFEVKLRRGQGGAGENHEQKYWYSENSFIYHDRNDVEDTSALRYLGQVKELMASYSW